jgi:hypothetical protein
MAVEVLPDPPPCRKLRHTIHGGPPATCFVSEEEDGEDWRPCCSSCFTDLANVAASFNPPASFRVFHLYRPDGSPAPLQYPAHLIHRRGHPLDPQHHHPRER